MKKIILIIVSITVSTFSELTESDKTPEKVPKEDTEVETKDKSEAKPAKDKLIFF